MSSTWLTDQSRIITDWSSVVLPVALVPIVMCMFWSNQLLVSNRVATKPEMRDARRMDKHSQRIVDAAYKAELRWLLDQSVRILRSCNRLREIKEISVRERLRNIAEKLLLERYEFMCKLSRTRCIDSYPCRFFRPANVFTLSSKLLRGTALFDSAVFLCSLLYTSDPLHELRRSPLKVFASWALMNATMALLFEWLTGSLRFEPWWVDRSSDQQSTSQPTTLQLVILRTARMCGSLRA